MAKKKTITEDEVHKLITQSAKDAKKVWKVIDAFSGRVTLDMMLFKILQFYEKRLKDKKQFLPERAATQVLFDKIEEAYEDWKAGNYAVDEDE